MYLKQNSFMINKKQNLIILIKERINEEKNNNKENIKKGSILTLKGENFMLKKNLMNINDIDKEKIIRTVTSMKRQLINSVNDSLIDEEINNSITENKNNKYNKSIKRFKNLENKYNEEFDIDKRLYFNGKTDLKNEKYSKKNLNQLGKEIEINDKIISNKGDSEYNKYLVLENKKKINEKNVSRFAIKSSINEDEDIFGNNNISVYEYISFNNSNNKVKNSNNIMNNNDKIYTKENMKNNYINNNIYNFQSYEPKKINDGINLKRFLKIKTFNETKKSNNSDNNNSIKNINNNKGKYKNEKENIDDNISENKKLIIIRNSHNLKNPIDFEKNGINENKVEEQKLFYDKNILIENKYRNLNSIIQQNIKMRCFICERVYKKEKIFFPNCKIHFLCKNCIKNYYEDSFENNNYSLKCPLINCKGEIDFQVLETLISETHSQMFLNKQKKDIYKNCNNNTNITRKELFLKDTQLLFNTKIKEENLKLYSQKHVLDINSNEKFYLYNKNKDIYCNRCLKPTLFTKVNGYFIKCLNCQYRMCKFCLKEFENNHMDIMNEKHCKVYYRKREYFFDKKINFILSFLIQLFFIIAMYYLTFIGLYFLIFNFLKRLIKFNKNKIQNCFIKFIKYSFIYFFSFLLFLICFPFILIIYPYFPEIASLTDY